MMKGYSIDCDYLIRVKDHMPLPRPDKRLVDCDGSRLPIVLVSVYGSE